MVLSRLKLSKGGFTMIELLVVIAVIGVLAVAVLSSINPIEQVNKGRDTRTRSDAAQLLNAIDRFFAIHEQYPWNDPKYTPLTSETLYTGVFPDTAGIVCTATTEQLTNPPFSPGGMCLLDDSQEGDATNPNWLSALTQTEEVKQGIIDRITAAGSSTNRFGAMYIYKAASSGIVDDDVHICFYPTSKAFQDEAVDSCYEDYRTDNTINEHPPGACPAANYTVNTTYTAEMTCLP